MRTALTIAGSDSIGGAGVQVDVKAMAALGVHATSVITAITAQNTQGVDSILPIPEDIVQDQLDAVLKDCDIKAIKTGMLYSEGIIGIVADTLEDHPEIPLIVDPVMISGTGCALNDDTFVKALKRKLLPICELVTPNKYEAEVLAGMKIRNADDATLACELIGKEGTSVLLKGGHFNGPKVVDYLYLSSEFNRLEYPRLPFKSGHGSGCTLSSFITANMAKGLDVMNAVFRSRELIQESISSQYAIGKGDPVVNPMVRLKNDTEKFKVLEEIDNAVAKLVNILPTKFVPKEGMNMAYALMNAAGPEDIAAVEHRVTVHNGMVRKGGQAKFGSGEHLSFILLAAMKTSPESRCALNIAYSDETVSILEEVDYNVVKVEFTKDKVLEATHEAIRKAGGIPDAIIEKGSRKGRMIRILAKNPADMLEKLETIL